MKAKINYCTADEKKFLDKLGSFATPLRIIRMITHLEESVEERRLKLLQNYKESMKKRVRWGTISRPDTAIYINSLLKEFHQELV